METIYSSNECWKIEKVDLDDNLFYYAFTCPCLFKIQFSRELYDSTILFQRLMDFDAYIYPKSSLWVIYRTDVYYHAILLSEEVNTKDKQKVNKYMEVLNTRNKELNEQHGDLGYFSRDTDKNVYPRHVHNFSRLYDKATNESLPRSLPPLLMSYFGNISAADPKCIYLASIYNTLVQNTILNNDKLLQPSYLKNMEIKYIQPVIPQIIIENYIKYFYAFVLLCGIYIYYQIKTYKKMSAFTIISLLVLVFVVYYIFRFAVIKYLINKSYALLVKYHDNYHMRCHMSCDKMFKLSGSSINKLELYEDTEKNKLDYKNFGTNEYKKHNFDMLDESIHKSRNDCHFNCGNGGIALTNYIYNSIPYKHLQSDYTMLLDSINHIYMMLSDHDERANENYYNLVTRYFDFVFV